MQTRRRFVIVAQSLLLASATLVGAHSTLRAQGLQSADLTRFRSVREVALSPDGRSVAYTVAMGDQPGRPYTQLWVVDVATQKAARVGGEHATGSSPDWSPDGKWIAYEGSDGDQNGLWVARTDGSGAAVIASVASSNAPLPDRGDDITWSPDSKQIAFISSTPGPEPEAANGDPKVFTRYLYHATAEEGLTHFNDTRHLHIFVVDVGSKSVRQLTTGVRDEHSIDWSPDGKRIVFVSNYEPNSDEFFNYDLFTVQVADGGIRRLTATDNAEYAPRWSPDGKRITYSATTRGLTDRETTMEDTHAWLMDADGSHRREIGTIDARQGHPTWSADGSAIYVAAELRGSVHLLRIPVSPTGTVGAPQIVVNDIGTVDEVSAGKGGLVAYSFTSPRDMAELYVRTGAVPAPRKLTDLNAEVLAGKQIAAVDTVVAISNDNKYDIESFLVLPIGLAVNPQDTSPAATHPLIVEIHGGPHGQNGPAFNFQDQVYAAHGWATLHVNYRGSTGYGQKFADAILGDQDGNEGQDVLYAVSATLRRNLWIDRERLGIEGVSYGGQLTDWLITQTNEFKAAVPTAGISNLVSFNYMTYYNQYLEMEYGQFLHQGMTMDLVWNHSAIKYVAQVHTPTMFMHGENDPDVPIGQAEQFFIGLKDVGVETIFVRYPREGHGLAETKHIIDAIGRKIAWYEKHFPKPGAEGVTNTQP